MNILVTVDENYLTPLTTMLFSLYRHHPQDYLTIYLLKQAIPDHKIQAFKRAFRTLPIEIIDLEVDNARFKDFPTTNRYPHAMYYRLFAAAILPTTLDKVLYLDPDLIILRPLHDLYHIDLSSYFFAASSHVTKNLEKVNQWRLNYEEGIYANSGVMMLNLKEMRERQDPQAILDFIQTHKNLLILPDQDVLSSVYAQEIIEIRADLYNMTERMYTKKSLLDSSAAQQFIQEECCIIHYIGRNKPWKPDYFGKLDQYWHQAVGYQAGLVDGLKLN